MSILIVHPKHGLYLGSRCFSASCTCEYFGASAFPDVASAMETLARLGWSQEEREEMQFISAKTIFCFSATTREMKDAGLVDVATRQEAHFLSVIEPWGRA